eukprot:14488538-Alexandrium_andersonii.AAC.1
MFSGDPSPAASGLGPAQTLGSSRTPSLSSPATSRASSTGTLLPSSAGSARRTARRRTITLRRGASRGPT